jgi:DnaJ-class molecular chaperone
VSRNLYDVLGVPPTATEDEIQLAFRNLSKTCHPDKDGGSKEAFQEIQHAYDVLHDPAKRYDYDTLGVEANTKEGVAAKMFRDIMKSVVDKWQPGGPEPLQAALHVLSANASSLTKKHEDSNVEIDRLEHLRGRFKTKATVDLVAPIIEEKIEQARKDKQECMNTIELISLTLDILRQYTWVEPEMQEPPAE